MKRADFIRRLEEKGCYLKRHGGRHDVYANPRNRRQAPVPRHKEIRNSLCRLIERQLGIER